MGSGYLYLPTLLSIFVFSAQHLHGRSDSCHFPAMFNFGDSNSDTGNVAAAFALLPPPNGETFFGKPSGRYSDGRVIVDFLADELGIPYLSAYLDSVASNFRQGTNFAAGGATIQHADADFYAKGFSPFSLEVQIEQFGHFKSKINGTYYNEDLKNDLPKSEDFSRALYTLDCGQNDLHYMLISMTEELVRTKTPKVVDRFLLLVERLYRLGARAFWIHNTGPIGCLPFFLVNFPPKAENTDQNGCVKSYNDIAQAFNKQLRKSVSSLRDKLQDASFVYVDIYSAKYSIISEAKKYGFHPPAEYCCGKTGVVDCWLKDILVNGSVCSDPSKYISWDGTHYTEAANKLVTKLIIDGSYTEPQFPISKACAMVKSKAMCPAQP